MEDDQVVTATLNNTRLVLAQLGLKTELMHIA